MISYASNTGTRRNLNQFRKHDGSAMTKQELELAKLRFLLYSAIVELQYVQDAENHSQCASSNGRTIIERGMKLLGVTDLSEEVYELRLSGGSNG